MKMFVKLATVVTGAIVSMQVFALDTVAAIASIGGATTDVEAIAVAIIGVAAIMFGIAKIRSLLKA